MYMYICQVYNCKYFFAKAVFFCYKCVEKILWTRLFIRATAWENVHQNPLVIPILMHFALKPLSNSNASNHLFCERKKKKNVHYLHKAASAVSCIKPIASQWKVTLHGVEIQQYIAEYTVTNFRHYPIRCHVTYIYASALSALECVFIVCMKKLCILGYPNHTQWRFWSEWVNVQAVLNLIWGYIFWHCCSYIC